MMPRLPRPFIPLVLALTLLVSACSVIGSSPTPPPGVFETQIADIVHATLTAAAASDGLLPTAEPSRTPPPTSAATDTAAPTSQPATATPRPLPTTGPPTSEFFTDANYRLADERLIGEYAVRVWENAAPTGQSMLGVDRIVTIERTGETPVQVEFFSALDALTGTDITGDDTPEVIIETYSGGAHCCFGTIVYSLGAELTKILDRASSNCGGQFQDQDGDGVLEYQTCDDVFAYTYCPYAATPTATVVLAFDPGQGYVPASPRFASLYADDITRATQLAAEAQPGALGEWDATTKCAVLPLVLAHLYAGQTDQAWQALEQYYAFPDAAAFREEVETTVRNSPLYVAPNT